MFVNGCMSNPDGRKLSDETLHDLRRRVVSAVEEKGMKAVEAMRIFGVGRTALFRWLKEYRAGGVDGLIPSRRGRPKGQGKLTARQAVGIVRLIKSGCPDQMELPFPLWTREAVRELISRQTGLSLSISTVGRLLKGWGFSPPPKSVQSVSGRNREFFDEWMKSTYPEIRKESESVDGEIHWCHEMGLAADLPLGVEAGKSGENPTRSNADQRFEGRIFSTVTNQGKWTFMVSKGRSRQSAFSDFLGRLERCTERKVSLIVEDSELGWSKPMRAKLQVGREKIRLHRHPGYEPDLAPQGLVNREGASKTAGSKSPEGVGTTVGKKISLKLKRKLPQGVKRFLLPPSYPGAK